LIMICSFLCVSCPTPPSDNPEPGKSAQYRYLDFLYYEGTGQSYNNQYLAGNINNKFPSEVQTSLDYLLRFPLQESIATASSSSWWNSIPSIISTYTVQNGNAALSDSLDPFFKSEIGSEMLCNLLDELYTDMLNVDDKLTDAENAIKADELNNTATVEIVSAGIEAVLSLGDSIISAKNPLSLGINIFGMVLGMNDIASESDIVTRIDALGDKINEIDTRLIQMQNDLSVLKDYLIRAEVASLYKPVQDARDMLAVKKTEINALLVIEPEELPEYIKNFLYGNVDPSFKTMYLNTKTYAQETQKYRIENNLIKPMAKYCLKKFQAMFSQYPWWIPPNTGIDVAQFTIERPDFFIKSPVSGKIANCMASSDILFMIDLGKFQMDIAGMSFEGKKLLDFKKFEATNQLADFKNINEAVENGVVNIDNRIASIAAGVPEPIFGGTNPLFPAWSDIYVLVDTESNEALFSLMGWDDPLGMPDPWDALKGSDQYVLNGINRAPDYFYTRSLAGARDYLKNKLTERYYYEFNAKEFFIRLKSIIAAWQIILQSHIDAAGNS
jgi:hypothetical protein